MQLDQPAPLPLRPPKTTRRRGADLAPADTQIDILTAIARGNRATGTIAGHLGLTSNAACKRLRVLASQGLVTRVRFGRWALLPRAQQWCEQ